MLLKLWGYFPQGIENHQILVFSENRPVHQNAFPQVHSALAMPVFWAVYLCYFYCKLRELFRRHFRKEPMTGRVLEGGKLSSKGLALDTSDLKP